MSLQRSRGACLLCHCNEVEEPVCYVIAMKQRSMYWIMNLEILSVFLSIDTTLSSAYLKEYYDCSVQFNMFLSFQNVMKMCVCVQWQLSSSNVKVRLRVENVTIRHVWVGEVGVFQARQLFFLYLMTSEFYSILILGYIIVFNN